MLILIQTKTLKNNVVVIINICTIKFNKLAVTIEGITATIEQINPIPMPIPILIIFKSNRKH